MWDEIRDIKSGRKELHEFGLLMGIILIVIGIIALWRGKASYPYLIGIGVLFLGFGFIMPEILKPLHKIWMGFSVILGFFMSRLILVVLFYGVMTPISLITKIMGKDILDERICREKASYWKKRAVEVKARNSYEKQY